MNEEKILAFIKLKTDRPFIENMALKKKPDGVTAQDIEQAFSMFRSNASALLNAMVKKGRLIKIESRPVYFLSAETLWEYLGNAPKHFTFSVDDFFNLFRNDVVNSISAAAPSFSKDAFDIIIGSRASLAEQVNQAKAAISYPPHGLHTLIIGESGTGKTLFSKAMHNFGLKALGKTEKNYPYVAFNCADYYHNPQLLMSQLFGHVKGGLHRRGRGDCGYGGKS